MLRAFVLAALTAAKPPKTIVHLHTSPTCDVVQNVIRPFVAMQHRNDAFLSRIGMNLSKYVTAGGRGPGKVLAGGNIDWNAARTYVNLAHMDILLKRSYERIPKGRDPLVDSLRLRMQAMVDAERILLNRTNALNGRRRTNFNYWQSTVKEIEAVQRLDGSPVVAPPRRQYAFRWFYSNFMVQHNDFQPMAQLVGRTCTKGQP